MNGPGLLWVGIAIVVVIFLDLLFVETRRIVREAKRIATRLAGYGDLPIISLAAAAENDAERLAVALEAIPELIERGSRAFTVLSSFGRVRPDAGDYLPKGSSPG